MLDMETQTDSNVVDEWWVTMSGGVSLLSDEHYADACRLWNEAVQRRLAMIALRGRVGDMQAAGRAARCHGLPLSVRGGDGWAGRALRDGGLVLGLAGMRDAAMDPRVWVAREPAGPDAVTGDASPMMASEDFACPMQSRPGCSLRLGDGVGSGPVRHPCCDFDDASLPVGTAFRTRRVGRCPSAEPAP